MSGKLKYTTIICGILTLLVSGCKHYAAFPELEEGVVSDEQNISYDDSIREQEKVSKKVEKSKIVKKDTKENSEKEQPVQEKKKIEKTILEKKKIEKTIPEKKKIEKTIPEKKVEKDLTIPDSSVQDIPNENVNYVVPSKTTPVVITDIDLTEMDAEDSKPKIIKPVTETKIILPVKKERRVLNEKISVKPNAESSVFYLAETVYFNNDGSSVDSSYYKKLRQIVKEAKAHKGKIIVQGFASSRTKNTDVITHKMANLKVSVARAENIAKILAQYGMPKNRIITEGLSDSRPVYQEVMPEGERLNRRAEIYISY